MVGVAGQDRSRKMWMEAVRDGLVEKPSSSELGRASGRRRETSARLLCAIGEWDGDRAGCGRVSPTAIYADSVAGRDEMTPCGNSSPAWQYVSGRRTPSFPACRERSLRAFACQTQAATRDVIATCLLAPVMTCDRSSGRSNYFLATVVARPFYPRTLQPSDEGVAVLPGGASTKRSSTLTLRLSVVSPLSSAHTRSPRCTGRRKVFVARKSGSNTIYVQDLLHVFGEIDFCHICS